jgi:alkylation response protein AidB-like acyl-CoA dehydrogenase
MDVRLTDEQRMVQQLAAQVAADLTATAADGPDDDRSQWASLAEAGLVCLHLPTEVGGGGASVVEAALVAEELAAALTPVPFAGAAAWAPTLLAAAGADEAAKATAAGRLRLAPVLRTDLSALARPGEDGVAFDARGAQAGLLINGDGGLHTVALGEQTRGADLTRSLRRVASDAPEIGLGLSLGTALTAQGRARVDAVALVLMAADLLGTAQRSLDEALLHVRERRQFGAPIGSFQAVQHLAAHAATLAEGARSATWHAAWAATELAADDALLASRQAKAYCSTAARTIAETAVQMFGGIALTWEHHLHVRLRRILLSRQVLGDESAQYRAIADHRLAPAGRH